MGASETEKQYYTTLHLFFIQGRMEWGWVGEREVGGGSNNASWEVIGGRRCWLVSVGGGMGVGTLYSLCATEFAWTSRQMC